MYLVHFKSESGDAYYAIFKDEPSEEELKAYMVGNFQGEIEDGICYVRVDDIIEFKEFSTIPKGVNADHIEWL